MYELWRYCDEYWLLWVTGTLNDCVEEVLMFRRTGDSATLRLTHA